MILWQSLSKVRNGISFFFVEPPFADDPSFVRGSLQLLGRLDRTQETAELRFGIARKWV